ncbi:hypothetical protein Ocin01_18876, partial [Orchesella cincta]
KAPKGQDPASSQRQECRSWKFEKSTLTALSLSEDGGRTTREIGKRRKLKMTNNPDWETEFEIDFIREHQQYFLLRALGEFGLALLTTWIKGNLTSHLPNYGRSESRTTQAHRWKASNPDKCFRIIALENQPPMMSTRSPPKKPYVEVAYVDNPDGTPHKIGTHRHEEEFNCSEMGMESSPFIGKGKRPGFRMYTTPQISPRKSLSKAWSLERLRFQTRISLCLNRPQSNSPHARKTKACT